MQGQVDIVRVSFSHHAETPVVCELCKKWSRDVTVESPVSCDVEEREEEYEGREEELEEGGS